MQSHQFKTACLALLLVLNGLNPVLAAPTSAPPMMPEAEIKQLLQDAIEKQRRAPGIAVAVIDENGTRIYSHGKRKAGGDDPVGGDTLFEIGSISKAFTSLLLADMVQRGEVKLDDSISKYLPASVKAPTRNGKEITLVDLATHTSGLPRLPSNLSWSTLLLNADNPYAKYTVEQMYEFLSGYELERDIGAKYEYSNYGAGLLGHLLALKAGTNYEALVKQRICGPLQMTSTTIFLSPEFKQRLATGHNESGKPVSNWDIPTLAGAGALRSSVNDMAKFVTANLGLTKTELSSAMELQREPRRSTDAPNLRIGLGWHIGKQGSRELVWHNGGTGGYHSFAGFVVSERRGVVVLANSSRDIDDLARLIIGWRKPHKVAAIKYDVYDRYVGEYDFPPKRVFKITRKGDQLFAQLTGQGALEIFPESETEFFYKVVDAQISFVSDGSGKVTGLVLHQGGADFKAPKIK